MSFLGMACAYAMRVSLSVAIVGMVKQGDESKIEIGSECPIENNTMEEMPTQVNIPAVLLTNRL